MVSGKSTEELPPGWKEHVKVTNGRKIKYYTHEAQGLKVYSKKCVMSHAKAQEAFLGTPQPVCEQKQSGNTPKSEVNPVVSEKDVSLEWLPLGWIVESRTRKNGSSAGSVYKIYVDPSTGFKFYSKPQVIKYLERVDSNAVSEKQKQEVNGEKCSKEEAPQNFELVEGKSDISGEEDNDMGKISLKNDPCVVDRSTVLDDLPSGWVKEMRPRKLDHKRKDPYYIDPVSQYEFRSKMDALRYLETGDIGSCASKPKKSQVKFEDAICASPRTDCFKLDLMAVDDRGAVSSSATAVLLEVKQPEAEGSKETESHHIHVDSKFTTADANEDRQLCSELIKCGGSEHSCETKFEGSELSVKINDNIAVPSTGSVVSQDQKNPKHRLDTKTQILSRKSKKRNPTSMPVRSSKRLSGQEPEMLPLVGSIERPVRAAVKEPVQKEADVLSVGQKEAANRLPVQKEADVLSVGQKVAANRLPDQLEINQQREVTADLPSPCNVASLETEMQNNSEKPSLGQAVPEQAVEQVQEGREEDNPRSQDSHLWYPFGDSLSDPCYEFAFKTLTGEIPFEDALAFQNLFQQPIGASCTQGVVGAGLPDIDINSSFQNDVSYQLDAVPKNVSAEQQLPTNSTIQSANINLPSCSNFGCQQPSLEARRKDYETKVNS